MVVYNISYGEPQRRFDFRKLLIVLGILLALILLAAAAYGIYWLFTDEDGIDLAAPSVLGAEASDAVAATPLNEILPALFQDNTNTVFLVDVSKSIEDGGNLPIVKQALLDVVLPYVDPSQGRPAENSNVALMTFTDETDPLVPMASFDETEGAKAEWLNAVNEMATQDRPAYIYDAVKDAHLMLAGLDEKTKTRRANVIVLLTDGSDGGFKVIDPASATPCPDGMGAPGQVCSRTSDAGGNDAAYTPFDPADLDPCPAGLAVAPGRACVESSSETIQNELLRLLGTEDKVPNMLVHTIGFGQEADQTLLKLLAKAGKIEGRYVYADH